MKEENNTKEYFLDLISNRAFVDKIKSLIQYEPLPDDHWIWKGTVRGGIHPAIHRNGQMVSVRRLIYCSRNLDLLPIRYVRAACERSDCVNPHHASVHRAGDVDQRIQNNIERTPDGCWIWTGSVYRDVPMISMERGNISVRRHLYGIDHDIERSKRVINTCGNRKCVKSDHSTIGH